MGEMVVDSVGVACTARCVSQLSAVGRHGRGPRRKAFVVPVILQDCSDAPRFLLVRDRQTTEWGFISGGCRACEDFATGGGRELEEETRGVVPRDTLLRPLHFDMHTRCRTQGSGGSTRVVHTHYRVFVFAFLGSPEVLKREFHERAPRNRAEAETDDVTVATLDEMHNLNVWEEVQTNLLRNPQFHRVVRALVEGKRGKETLRSALIQRGTGMREAIVREVRRQLSVGAASPGASR